MFKKPLAFAVGRSKKILLEGLPFIFFFVVLWLLTKKQYGLEKAYDAPAGSHFQRERRLESRGLRTNTSYLNFSENSGFLPSGVIPSVSEELSLGSTLREDFQFKIEELHVSPVSLDEIQILQYVKRQVTDPSKLYKGARLAWTSWGQKLGSIAEYFRYLQLPQANCGKLKRMGGILTCDQSGDGNNMDGHKYVCMDTALRLPSPRRNCLTLSFGTYFETSFDEVMVELPCEVHMFDVLDYRPSIVDVFPNAHFHKEGLAGNRRIDFFSNAGHASADKYTLRDVITRHNLTDRLIHVLKVDIENSEWESFREISKDPIFDAVGQVALEVHALDVVKDLKTSWSANIPKERWLQVVQEKYEVLRDIEKRGFRRVLYWDNHQTKYPYIDESSGTRYETSGELLYINTNWYNRTFMKELSSRGYNVPE